MSILLLYNGVTYAIDIMQIYMVIINVLAHVECYRRGFFGNFLEKCAKFLAHAVTRVPNRAPNRPKFKKY